MRLPSRKTQDFILNLLLDLVLLTIIIGLILSMIWVH